MGTVAPIKVLVVVGDPALSAVVARALTHPQLQIETAVSEQAIVAALTTRQYELVLVGGHVGKRGPLVLCDVVRVRQSTAAVLVLLRQDTDEGQLQDHVARQLPRVYYLDLRAAPAGLEQGAAVRDAMLGALQLAEDEGAAAAWPQLVAGVGGAGEAPADAGAAIADEQDLVFEGAAGGAGPAISDAVTEEDLVFAARMVSRTRGVDFRSPFTPQAAPEGTERATVKLRDRVRELERHLARLAHAYGGRMHEFDGAAERIAQANAQRDASEKDLQRLREHLAEERERWREHRGEREGQLDAQTRRAEALEARLNEAGAELARLREELRTKEVGFAGMLKQAHDAFTQLREQSAQALAFYERRVGEQEKQAQLAAEELASLRAAATEANARIADYTRELDGRAQVAGELAAATAAYNEQRELAERARSALSEAEGQLAAARAELAAVTDRAAQGADGLRRDGAAALAEKTAVIVQLEQKIAEHERGIDVRNATLTEREREVATLATRLDARDREVATLAEHADERDRELARLRKEHADLRDELERARERGLERALDARLVAVEEHARLAAESASRQGEFLGALDQRSAKQATLVDRLLRIIEPPEFAGGGPVTSVVAARRLAERMRPDESVAGRLWHRLREPPWIFGAVGLLIVAVVLAIIVAMSELPELGLFDESAPFAAVRDGGGQAAGAAATGDGAGEQRDPAEPVAADNPAAGTAPAVDAADEAAAKTTVVAAQDDLPIVLTPDERKNLRRKMFDSHKAKKWDEVVRAGLRLRAAGKMDWEAEYNLASALRSLGRNDEALAIYKAFLAEFPTNRFAAEAKAAVDKLSKR